jgi:tetratricopeptide (TPR) repeat protein
MTQTASSQPASDPSATATSAEAVALVSQGLKLHQAGQFAAAAAIYRRALAIKPDEFDALHLLGVVFHQCGHHAEAAQQIDIALAQQPDNVFALNNLGIVLGALQRFDDALSRYERALALQPNYVEAWLNRGSALLGLRRFAEAVASYDRALALRPDYAEAHSNRGSALNGLGRHQEALASCDRALAVRADYPEALLSRGNALRDLKQFDGAMQSYDAALALQPDYVEALCNRAVALCDFKRFEEALANCDRALALRPHFAEAHSNRGNALMGLEGFEEALASYDRAVALQPNFAEAYANRGGALHSLNRFVEALAVYDHAVALMPSRAETHYNRANVLYGLKRFDEALAGYDRALALRPNYVEPLTNRGVTFHDLGRFDEAVASYDRVRLVQSDYADAHYNEALCRLLTGDLRRGFEKLEWRWETEQLGHGKRNFSQPLWTGAENLAGKTILLHAEQGFGDTIQFCRYAPLVAARGAQIVLEVQAPLRRLMPTLPCPAQIIVRDEPLPDFDLHCPLLSLPRSFATELATVPGETPYLQASADAVADWRERLELKLGGKAVPRIGIAWSGRPTHKNDHNRSIALDFFLQIFAGVDARVVSLQREVRGADAPALQAHNDVVHFGEELEDFSDTAALIENLDLVVAVDTSVVHLAGALGKPVWVLLPFMPDWRWLLDRDDSPWYPSARLFRQDEARAWDSVIMGVNAALRDLRAAGEAFES